MKAVPVQPPVSDVAREPLRRAYATAAVYLVGALIYAPLVEVADANFALTPLFMGGVMLAAATIRPRLLASAVLLGAWGVAVLLLQHDVLPGSRTGAVYLVAFGSAMVLLSVLRRRFAAPIALESAAAVMFVGGLALYLSYDYGPFGRGWFWALVLALNALGLVIAAHLRDRP